MHNDIQNLLLTGKRCDLLRWLALNDPNGVYTDEDSLLEDMEPLTLDEARELVRKIYFRG